MALQIIRRILMLVLSIFLIIACCSSTIQRDEPIVDPDPPAEHTTHVPGEEIHENVVVSTCFGEGSYDVVTYCVECGIELSRRSEVTPISEHVPAEPVKENEIVATCRDDGSFDSVVYCSFCDLEFSRTEVFVERGQHVLGDPVSENVVSPVCKNNGYYDSVVRCTLCDTEVSRERLILPAEGHRWVNGYCADCRIPYSVVDSLEFTLSDDGTYYIITGVGTCRDTRLVMPSEYNGKPVKEIGTYAFKDCYWIVEAVIPKTIVKLGYGAAIGCTSLQNLEFEDKNNWEIMYGYDATEGTQIHPLLFFAFGVYKDKLIEDDQFWMRKIK